MSERVVPGQELLSIPAALAPLTAAGNSRGSGWLKSCEAIVVIAALMIDSPKNAAVGTATCWLCRGAPALDWVWRVASALSLRRGVVKV